MTKANINAPYSEAKGPIPHNATSELEAGTARLLRRKKLTGEDLGRALLLSFVHDFRHREEADAAPLFTQEQLEQMVSCLPSEYERDIYRQFAAVYEDLIALFRQAQGLVQQLMHGLCRLSNRVSLAEKVLLLERRVSKLSGLDGDPALPDDIHALFPEDFEGILTSPALQTELRSSRDLLTLPAYAELTAYNAMLETLARGLALPELLELCSPLEDVRAEAATYDILLARCYAALPPEESTAFRGLCLPLALESIQPDEEAMARFIGQLKVTGPDPRHLVQALRPDWQEVAHA